MPRANRAAVAEQADRLAAGKANGPCGCGCGRTVFWKPNRAVTMADGSTVYFQVGCEPRGRDFEADGPIPKPTTIERWTGLGLGPQGRAVAREAEQAEQEPEQA